MIHGQRVPNALMNSMIMIQIPDPRSNAHWSWPPRSTTSSWCRYHGRHDRNLHALTIPIFVRKSCARLNLKALITMRKSTLCRNHASSFHQLAYVVHHSSHCMNRSLAIAWTTRRSINRSIAPSASNADTVCSTKFAAALCTRCQSVCVPSSEVYSIRTAQNRKGLDWSWRPPAVLHTLRSAPPNARF